MSFSVAFIGLGSNLGDRDATLKGAIEALGNTPGLFIRSISSFYETEPDGGPTGQGNFLNAAAEIETTIDPFALLKVLREIETRFGRVRTIQWGERTLDLDLLLFGDQIINTTELSVPHPRFRTRRFVLEPLAEVAPTAVDPVTERTIAELLTQLNQGLG